LRHKPEALGLTLMPEGWVSVDELIANSEKNGNAFTFQILKEIVDTCPKQRYAFSACENYIRANQGHSANVDMQYKPEVPPDILIHGTTVEAFEKIKAPGLSKMSRQYVHLTENHDTAETVAARYGKNTVILVIDAKKMHQYGFVFYKSENNVWLTDNVPTKYLIGVNE
jgi:putative RNA 2'-phosphotransferase